jgi:hypothetical protein
MDTPTAPQIARVLGVRRSPTGEEGRGPRERCLRAEFSGHR